MMLDLFGFIARTVFGSVLILILASLVILVLKLGKKVFPNQPICRAILFVFGLLIGLVILSGLFFLLLKIGMNNMN